jgi:hypothetical protein
MTAPEFPLRGDAFLSLMILDVGAAVLCRRIHAECAGPAAAAVPLGPGRVILADEAGIVAPLTGKHVSRVMYGDERRRLDDLWPPAASVARDRPVEIAKTYWTMEGEGRRASAILVRHPLGFELRVLEGGELRRSQVHSDGLKAESDALDTYKRLLARGWEPV